MPTLSLPSHDPVSRQETLNSGKPFKESEWDIDDVAGCLRYFAQQGRLVEKQQNTKLDVGDDDFVVELRHEPAGVVAAIVPWNYPVSVSLLCVRWCMPVG